MTLKDLRGLDIFQTRFIAEDDNDRETHAYIMECLQRFYSGDYGEIPQEDADANNAELAEGKGRVIARYKKAHNLERDFYIMANFNIENPDKEANYIMIMYNNNY